MPRFLLIPLFLLHAAGSIAQGPVGSWEDHLPYNSCRFVTVCNDEVFASTEYAITVYNRTYNEIRKLSKVNGLSECGIRTINYSPEESSLVIAYESGNIDLYDDGRLINIPDIKDYFLPGNIRINRIRSSGGYAYLASSQGIIIINISKAEVKDTWKPSVDGNDNEIFDLCISGDTVFAATGNGLFKAPLSDQGLAYYGNWDLIRGSSGNDYNCIALAGGRVFANKVNTGFDYDSVFYIDEGKLFYLQGLPPGKNHSFETHAESFIISSGALISIVDYGGNLISTIDGPGDQALEAWNTVMDGNDIFVADGRLGLVRMTGGDSFTNYIPQGPPANNCYYLTASDGQIWVAGGAVSEDWENMGIPFMLFKFSERRWWDDQRAEAWDVTRVAPLPSEPGHAFVSTWGYGIYEYNNNVMVNHWSEDELGSSIPGQPYVRIHGMAVDGDKNLWISQSGVENNIKVLMNGTEWISLPYHPDATVTGDMLITGAGHKWIILPDKGSIFVLDDNKTPAYPDDDRYKEFQVKDQDGRVYSRLYSIAADLDGNIWLGTDHGPLIYYFPGGVFDQDLRASRIKIPRNDGSGLADYLLSTESILTIAVDGGNRKWLGTGSSGAFLISQNSDELVKEFNTSNSPLPADHIMSIATDGKTGEVWFGTSKGIVTLRETGTTGSEEMDKVYSFPNPVREDYEGDITITGLARNSDIKITDISGNLVYETRSTGGDASWDMRTYNGRKVSTGVYLVFCTSQDGTESAVTKILIIR